MTVTATPTRAWHPQARATIKAGTYSPDAHTVEWVMSDETTDRDGEVLSVGGWSIPGSIPLLWGHRSWGDPTDVIGKVDAVRVEGGQLIGTLRFSQANPTAQLVEAMVAEGVLENGSVGFDPLAWTDPDGSEHTRVRGGPYPWPKAGRRYTAQELAEFSIVPVPSNPGATAKMANRLRSAGGERETALEAQVEALAGQVAELTRQVGTLQTVRETRREADSWDDWMAQPTDGDGDSPATADGDWFDD